MKLPSDAQAALLNLIAERGEAGDTVEWLTNPDQLGWHGPKSKAALLVEHVDRTRNTSTFQLADDGLWQHRLSTLRACLRHGWLADAGERTATRSYRAYSVRRKERIHRSETWWLTALELTEDGVIALGRWRERKLQSPPPELPVLTDHQREIIELAQRAYDLGYALCARKPARAEARKMRRDGWWDGCWVANSATGLVPSPLAVAEVFPERADEAPQRAEGW